MLDDKKLRLDGVYRMNDQGDLMQRIKVPAGVISSEQALRVADIAERFAGGRLHLTTRGSLELHRVRVGDLPEIHRMLSSVGLTGRGACGGAVRGVASSTLGSPHFPAVQTLARRIHRHFAGNPHFEALPKKFKIAVEAGYVGARHLIQDAGLVLVGEGLYDLWVAGGLGREPRAAFLLEKKVAEDRILPLLEGVLRVYGRHTPAGKRLKHLVRDIGEATFRHLLEAELAGSPERLPLQSVDGGLLPASGPEAVAPLEAPIFAGDLDAPLLRRLAGLARTHSGGCLLLTADQDIALRPTSAAARTTLARELEEIGLSGPALPFRVCVGSHACRLGLAPTREIARQVVDAMGPAARRMTWAISGCPNSCAQPQLAEVGILASKLVKGEGGERQPLFDLYRRRGEGLGEKVAEGVDLEALLKEVMALG